MTLCDQSTLLDLAGETTFERGREYFAHGQVIGFTDHGESAEGLVFGTRAYHTLLRRVGEKVSFYCDCPVGRTSRFCKHAVALGLQWLSGAEEKGGVEACERLFEQAINLLMLGEALFADWGELAMPMLDDLIESWPVGEAIELVESAMSKISEAQSLWIEEERDGEWKKVEELLCERHVMAIRRATKGAGFSARRALNWQLKQVGAGFDAERLGKRLCGKHGESWGDDWREAYWLLVEKYWRKLSQIDNERLRLDRRRQLVWLARRVEGGMAQVVTNVIAGQTEESVERLWEEFTASPTLGRFELLKECALSSGQWPQWRERVFEYSRQYAVEDDLSLKLAAMRIRTDPAEALALYQRLIRKLLSRKDRYSAVQASRLLRKTCRLMKRLGREEEYEEFIEELMQAFGSQRNFACAIADVTAKRNR
jgi:hypothetical protein